MTIPTFNGLHVLALETRRAKETASLITKHGGRPTMAPALREVPLESNSEALEFTSALNREEFDLVIFLTGVGLRALLKVVEKNKTKKDFIEALTRTKVVSRGPKPLAVLRELHVPIWATAPEPNTWRELLDLLDSKVEDQSLKGARVAVQEYGISNHDLLQGLRDRGAKVTTVPIYRWELPEDIAPLKDAVTAIIAGNIDVVLFTTSVQVLHLYKIAAQMGQEDNLHMALTRTVIASIGPTTTEALERHHLKPDLEPPHPKLGSLIRKAAESSTLLLRTKNHKDTSSS